MSKPDKAFILAAGYGSRMKPLTDSRPKPLVEIAGRPLLDYILEHLIAADVREIVVNAHHHGGKIVDWAETRAAEFDVVIHVAQEPELLETGGGVKAALTHFNDEPFYVIAGDAFWVSESAGAVFEVLADRWRSQDMDILMSLQAVQGMSLTRGVGDYDFEADGRVVRSMDRTGTYMFTNIRINHPRVYEGTPEDAFSFLECMDRAQEIGRLYGLEHEGEWCHISTPEDLARVNGAIGAKIGVSR